MLAVHQGRLVLIWAIGAAYFCICPGGMPHSGNEFVPVAQMVA